MSTVNWWAQLFGQLLFVIHGVRWLGWRKETSFRDAVVFGLMLILIVLWE